MIDLFMENRLFVITYTAKTHNMFGVDENIIEQCCAGHIVQRYQQYCSALLSLN